MRPASSICLSRLPVAWKWIRAPWVSLYKNGKPGCFVAHTLKSDIMGLDQLHQVNSCQFLPTLLAATLQTFHGMSPWHMTTIMDQSNLMSMMWRASRLINVIPGFMWFEVLADWSTVLDCKLWASWSCEIEINETNAILADETQALGPFERRQRLIYCILQ